MKCQNYDVKIRKRVTVNVILRRLSFRRGKKPTKFVSRFIQGAGFILKSTEQNVNCAVALTVWIPTHQI
jgi:hypothetical protein